MHALQILLHFQVEWRPDNGKRPLHQQRPRPRLVFPPIYMGLERLSKKFHRVHHEMVMVMFEHAKFSKYGYA